MRKRLPAFVKKIHLQLAFYLLVAFCGWFLHLGCQPIKALGKNPAGEDLKKIEALPNYNNGQFQNLETFPAARSNTSSRKGPRWIGLLKYFAGKPKNTKPSQLLPSVKTDLRHLRYEIPTVTWFGHSSFLITTSTATILFDPSFSGFAGPFPGMIRAFDGSNVYNVNDMPVIDALVISHDHYDHLDYKTVKALKKKVKRVIVPMGVGSHFRKWGYDAAMITELNWHDSVALPNGVNITATPAHHRSNRTFEQRKTLWASYVIKVDGYKIYFSGDTGYSRHFSMIGERYGPFDLALMECGQYNLKWSQNHMFPWQTARAAIDLKTAMVMPMHWGKFAESEHTWNEPVNLLMASADSFHLPVTVPYIGEPYTIGEKRTAARWWNFQ